MSILSAAPTGNPEISAEFTELSRETAEISAPRASGSGLRLPLRARLVPLQLLPADGQRHDRVGGVERLDPLEPPLDGVLPRAIGPGERGELVTELAGPQTI